MPIIICGEELMIVIGKTSVLIAVNNLPVREGETRRRRGRRGRGGQRGD